MRRLFVASVVALAVTQALAQEISPAVTDTNTVLGLVNAGFEIKGVIPTSAGPGILLQKQKNVGGVDIQDLMMCFVAETPHSETIATQYCKPVE